MDSLQSLHTEFTRAISSYFCVQSSTPEELLSSLQKLEVSPRNSSFIKRLEDTDFLTFQRLLKNSSGKTVAQLEHELEVMHAVTNDFISTSCDSDARIDLRAYLINFISYLPDLVETDLT